MTGWDRDFKENKVDYLQLFEKSMQKEQEANVEFLEEKTNSSLKIKQNYATEFILTK